MADSESPKKGNQNPPPMSLEELRQMVREDIEEQRKIADSLRRKMN